MNVKVCGGMDKIRLKINIAGWIEDRVKGEANGCLAKRWMTKDILSTLLSTILTSEEVPQSDAG